MNNARALRYRKLALQEPDKEKAELLQLLADESERGVLVTAEWLVPRRRVGIEQKVPSRSDVDRG